MERPDRENALRPFVGQAGLDVGCDVCFDELDRYVELQLAGGDVDSALPGMREHLDGCPACDEEYESLLALVGGQDS